MTTGTFAALKGRNYSLYWFGLVFYVLGHRAEYVTFAWITWELTHDHVTALAELEVPAPRDPQRFQVWLQTGDETLDYRLAQQYYRACALRIQAGGDHSFQGFVTQLPALLSFAGIGADTYQAIDFTAL